MLLRSAICIALFGIPAVALHAQDAGWARVYGASAAALDQAGIGSQRQRDYGGFVWVRLNADERERLARAGLRVETDPRAGRIMLGERSFDPLTDAPEAAATPPLSPAGYGLWLIQLDAPLKGEWAQALESAGIATLQYVPANVLLVWGRAAEVSAARSQSWVRWAGAYTPSFRSAAALRAATGTVSGLEVFFYAGADADGVRSALAALGARVDYVQRAQPDGRFAIARISAPATALDAIAALPEVVFVDQVAEPEHDDELPNQITAANFDGGGQPVVGYLDWLDSIGLSGGAGVNWAVADSGSDIDHPDLAPAYVGGANAPGCPTGTPGDDTGGHGSHVAGTILGRGTGDFSGPAQERDGQAFYFGQGVAPRAGLFPLRTIASGCSGWSEQDRSRVALESGLGIAGSNNSWNNSSSSPRLTYGTSERTHDIMVRDGNFNTAASEPFLLAFSAGNAGSGSGTITGPKAAKNMIVVGSTSNGRGGVNFNLMSGFSSRGPLADGRLAPTLSAVGGSTASTRRAEGGSCGTAIANTNGLYSNCSGTSMSTPMVSGGAILAIEWWRARNNGAEPSPAMLKAMLVNSARDLPGAAPGGTGNDGSRAIPNNDEGWGIMDLKAMLAPTVRGIYRDQLQVFTAAGQQSQLSIAAADPTQPLRVSVVWTDAPGAASLGAAPALVNDLHLEVEQGANFYRGNVFNGGFSQTGGSADALNNIESVYLQNPGAAALTVRVQASAINGDALSGNGTPGAPRQDFALLCTNCVETGYILSSSAAVQGLCTSPASPAVFPLNVAANGGFATPVTFTIAGLPSGASGSVSPNPVTPGGEASFTVSGAPSPGSYALSVNGLASSIARSLPLTLEVGAAVPGATNAAAPADATLNLDRKPSLSWAPVAGAFRYQVQIATDASFANLVASDTVTATSFSPSAMLAADTAHFWRVRAVNPCGNGSWSAARSFRTLVPVCSASALSIPDNSPAGASQQLGGATARLEHLALRVEATHPRAGDLRLVLRHVPSNTSAQVAARHLGCSLADIAADFDSRDGQIAQCFAGAPAALSGRLRPEQSFSVFAGLDAAGPWELRVADEISGSSGQITRWCVDLAVDGDALFRNGFEP